MVAASFFRHVVAPEIMLPAVMVVDTALVAWAAGWIAVAGGHARHGPLEALVAWGWGVLAAVTGVGVALGWLGGIGPLGFLAGHAVLVVLLAAARRGRWRDDARAAAAAARALRTELGAGGTTAWICRGLAAALGSLAVVALLAAPATYDALAYRLPRIGAWLQAGRIGFLETADARMNYMAALPDVAMAWWLGWSGAGFGGAAVVAAAGGALAAVATIGLARQSGLGRPAAALAGLLPLGSANVLVQFTALHTDLVAAGAVAAAVFLAWRAAERGEVSWPGGLGLGVAVAAKATVFHLLPALALWAGLVAWRVRPGRSAAVRWAAAAAAGLLWFAGPGLVRNVAAYGHPLGPAEEVRRHQRWPDTPAELGAKLGLNLIATTAQLFEPHAQPPGAREPARAVGAALAAMLPARDDDAFEARGRRGALEEVLARPEPDADVVSCGVLAVLLAAAGATAAIGGARPGCGAMRAWAAGLALYALAQHATLQWHAYGFRFHVLAAPWLAVLGAWAIEGAGRRGRLALWASVVAIGAATGAHVMLRTHQSGWRAVAAPERSRGFFVFANWRDWTRALGGERAALRVALPANLPVAAFFRVPGVRAEWAREPAAAAAAAESAVPADGGWLVVPAGLFAGREGRVAARTWLFRGDEGSAFSLAAYRRLRPGEEPAAAVYRHRVDGPETERRHALLVRAWPARGATLAIRNPDTAPWTWTVAAPGGVRSGRVAAGATVESALAVPADALAEVVVTLAPAGPAPTGAEPAVEVR